MRWRAGLIRGYTEERAQQVEPPGRRADGSLVGGEQTRVADLVTLPSTRIEARAMRAPGGHEEADNAIRVRL